VGERNRAISRQITKTFDFDFFCWDVAILPLPVLKDDNAYFFFPLKLPAHLPAVLELQAPRCRGG